MTALLYVLTIVYSIDNDVPYIIILDMASSSSTTTKESTDKQNKSNQITEIIHESSQVTSTSSPGNVDETRTDEYEYDTIRFVSDGIYC
jgi:hypothetical protein